MEKILTSAAKLLSAVFSPLFVPFYGMLVVFNTSYLAIVPSAARWIVSLVVLLITGIIPLTALYVMKRIGIIGDMDVSERTERTLPTLMMGICYVGAAFFLMRAQCPSIVVNMMWGGAAAVLVQLIVNRWWKISAHGAGMGALVAMVTVEATRMVVVTPMFPFLAGAILIAGIVGTCRLLLGAHTLMQVLAGMANGFLWVFLLTL